MDLKEWCEKAESNRESLANEYFNMQVGLPYSKEKIGELENFSSDLAKNFLKNFKEPKLLYYDSVASQVSHKLSKLTIQLHETRKEKVSISSMNFKNEKLNWTNWRQFASSSASKSRKKVFDEFVDKTKFITPIIEETCNTYKDAYSDYNIDVLEPYFFQHKIGFEKLKDVVDALGSSLKTEFIKQFNYYSNEVDGRDSEYFDDFYYMRNAVFGNLKVSNKFDILKSVKNRMKIVGFDVNRIKVDDQDRPGKYSSPFCYGINIPGDVRVSFKAENFINDTNSVYHEFGHAVHFSHIKKELPFWTRYYMSEALCETFSTFFENLISDNNYLIKELRFSKDEAEEIVKRMEFLDLFAITFYCANSMFKMDFWKKDMSMEQADNYYAKMIKKYMGVEVDGRYWQLHHILPEAVLYVPSYLLAMIRASELRNNLFKQYGNEWYNNKEAGNYIKILMESGTESKIASFENANPNILIYELLKND